MNIDHRQIRCARQACYIGKYRKAVQRLTMRVYKRQFTRETGTSQIAQHNGADRPRTDGRADERDAFGPEQLLEIPNGHRQSFLMVPKAGV